jgi:hypothetical protein
MPRFILKKTDSIPAFVPLFEEKQLLKLTGKATGTSEVFVKTFYPGTTKAVNDTTTLSGKLYRLIWQPLEPYLKEIKKISLFASRENYTISPFMRWQQTAHLS